MFPSLGVWEVSHAHNLPRFKWSCSASLVCVLLASSLVIDNVLTELLHLDMNWFLEIWKSDDVHFLPHSTSMK